MDIYYTGYIRSSEKNKKETKKPGEARVKPGEIQIFPGPACVGTKAFWMRSLLKPEGTVPFRA